MSAMNYEIIIRKAYGVYRHGVPEANADIYRRFEQAVRAVELNREAKEKRYRPISTTPIEDLEYEARRAGAQVGLNLTKAINYLLDSNYDVESKRLELEEIKGAFAMEYNQEKIEELMERINPIFSELDLKMG